jgi:hypothetical protein
MNVVTHHVHNNQLPPDIKLVIVFGGAGATVIYFLNNPAFNAEPKDPSFSWR